MAQSMDDFFVLSYVYFDISFDATVINNFLNLWIHSGLAQGPGKFLDFDFDGAKW